MDKLTQVIEDAESVFADATKLVADLEKVIADLKAASVSVEPTVELPVEPVV